MAPTGGIVTNPEHPGFAAARRFAADEEAAKSATNGHHADDPAPDEPAVDESRVGAQHSGQVRMAYRLAGAERDRLLHVHGVGWHHFDGQRWAYDDTGEAKRAVLDVLRHALAESLSDKQLRADVRRCESDSGINGVLGIASALTPFAAAVRDLDADPYLLNTANGTLDLHTRELRPPAPADRITKVCRGAYRAGAPSAPVWREFLSDVLPDEAVRGFVQRLAGLALLGEVHEHILPILTGTGANGKGTFYKAVLYALGDYAATADPDLFMHRDGAHPTGQMDLRGKRLVVVSESDEGRPLAEATVKRLTGGDLIKARYMRKDFVEFTPSHLPILVTNFLPKVSGDDPAIWRRLRVVPFDVVIPEDGQDKTLDARLQLEADGILSWAIAGLSDYFDRGLDEPDSVRAATDAYHTDSDAVGQFIAEECHQADAVKITASDLFDAWERWRKLNSSVEISRKAFGLSLGRKGFTSTDSNSKRWWQGICVREGAEQ
jgi:putative DNA primase/helicase